MSPRRSLRRLAVPGVVVGVASTLTTLLAQHPVGASFTATTTNTGSSVSSAASFPCASGPTYLSAVDVAWTDQAAPSTPQGSTQAHVQSAPGANRRTWLRFALPAAPAHCTLSAATLRLYDSVPTAGRVIDVYAGSPSAPAWSPASITWDDQPGPASTPLVGSQTSSTPGWQVWGVLPQVQDQYAHGNNGVDLQDRTESASPATTQQYDVSGTTAPQLQLDWR